MKTLFPLIALEDEYVCSDCRSTDMLETQEKDGDIYRYYVMCKECGKYLEIQKYTDGKHQCPIAHCQSTIVLEVRERKDRRYNNYLLCNNCSFIFGGDAVHKDNKSASAHEPVAEIAAPVTAPESSEQLELMEDVNKIEDLFSRHRY